MYAISLLNPFSSKYHCWRDSKTLPASSRAIIGIATTSFALLTLGFGTVMAFRLVTRKLTENQEQSSAKFAQILQDREVAIVFKQQGELEYIQEDTKKNNLNSHLNGILLSSPDDRPLEHLYNHLKFDNQPSTCGWYSDRNGNIIVRS